MTLNCKLLFSLLFSQDAICCSYADALSAMSGFDCIQVRREDLLVGRHLVTFLRQIPGAVTKKAMGVPTKSNICGNRMGLPTDTVCSKLSKKAFSKKKTLSNTRASLIKPPWSPSPSTSAPTSSRCWRRRKWGE